MMPPYLGARVRRPADMPSHRPDVGVIIYPEEADTFLEGGYVVAEETHRGAVVLVARRPA